MSSVVCSRHVTCDDDDSSVMRVSRWLPQVEVEHADGRKQTNGAVMSFRYQWGEVKSNYNSRVNTLNAANLNLNQVQLRWEPQILEPVCSYCDISSHAQKTWRKRQSTVCLILPTASGGDVDRLHTVDWQLSENNKLITFLSLMQNRPKVSQCKRRK